MAQHSEYDAIIIGGGITGAGTARDCALRGLKVLLLERNDIATGATGRNHGLLHSGARYAVKDAESARECIIENRIIRRIAPHCVEQNGGIFITLPEDEESGYGLDYQARFIQACRTAGIGAEAISPEEALRLEPSVNPSLIGAVKVPDCSVDPFRLCACNVLDARLHGADIRTWHETTSLVMDGDAVVGVRARDLRSGEEKEFRSRLVINAAGIWGARIAEMAGARIGMYPAKGALLIFGHRVNNVVINRCRKSADGDILVPGGTVTVNGTSSTKVPFEECDDMKVTPDEVRLLLREGCQLCPSLGSTRILRAYAGVRPLVASDDDPTGRSISRGIVCLDHESRDGIRGFISITGGKLTDYRMMAEKATDLACSKLGVNASCTTSVALLPRLEGGPKGGALICECEDVYESEIRNAVDNLGARGLEDIRRRTRLGMGTCQGTHCIRRTVSLISGDSQRLQADYLNERWKGMMPVGWGDGLREMELMQKVYKKNLEV